VNLPFDTNWPVLDWRKVGELYVVIFDYMAFPQGAPSRNLFAYSARGEEIWRTEAYTELTSDGWTNFLSTEPLCVSNFSGYAAHINPGTGEVLGTKFTK
jgi:hypothetical protein